jgi:integrase
MRGKQRTSGSGDAFCRKRLWCPPFVRRFRFCPALAIGGSAGLRPAEVHRLTWDAVNLEERHISVSANASKTASRRLVPICDNLLAWLLRAPKRVGLVMPLSEMIERDLAVEAGHDQAVLHRHYRALATKTVAEKWFAILPGDGVAQPVPFYPKAARA